MKSLNNSSTLSFLIFLLLPFFCFGQYYKVPAAQILENSFLVVQGEVVSTTCIKHDEDIYTENVLQIEQVFLGDSLSNEVTILTVGGTMDGITQFQSHGFSLRKGDKGFFFLEDFSSGWGVDYFKVYAGQQGFYQKKHDGFTTKLWSRMNTYPSLNSFYKNFGFDYNEEELEEELLAISNPDACLKYRLQPIEGADLSEKNNIVFEIYISSSVPAIIREISILFHYSNDWFGQNILANKKLDVSEQEFGEDYKLRIFDVSTDVISVSLVSDSPIKQLKHLSEKEILLARVSMNFAENGLGYPILVENTSYQLFYYDQYENPVVNNCGHIQIRSRSRRSE